MVLKLLWRNLCHPNPEVPANLSRYLAAFRFPLLILGCEDPTGRVRVAMAEDILMPGLTLADAIYQELDILMPEQSVLLLIPQGPNVAPPSPAIIAAELLHALLLRNPYVAQQAPTIFEWAFRSLCKPCIATAPSRQALKRVRDETLAQVLSFPAPRAGMSLAAYLRLLDPGHVTVAADPGLSRRLARSKAVADWQETLWSCFETARSCGSIKIRQN